MLENVSLSISQGSLVGLAGSPSDKRLLLSMLAQRAWPDSGYVSIPGSPRVLSISPEPIFFAETIHGNLLLPVPPEEREALLNRIDPHTILHYLPRISFHVW